ncbi:TRAP transporter small permease subunit [Dichotomicrobium thermohalophilum]|uniref:TRAP transporter small permease protein n=1 Tax=Dichotomicrobium thermohalophilum TaxID=933063 RepID=A0A397Q5Z0_9HYPH|nr:TRAP transporter small permease subunit [Dichotomicrobium thermohalophilum]RIA56910.1 TRAP-type mannitol/chloroaromatic compound transport system permease small subunit [Dichotomicrobium thermohalophilum]
MLAFIAFIDRISAWFGKAFAWCIVIMTLGVSYEVFVRYLLRQPTSWAFDLTYMMYGSLFMMAGAYTLSRDGHVRGDVVYRLWPPKTQAAVELVLYIVFFFPGVTALIVAGWQYAERSLRYLEVSVMSPANVPIFQFKLIIVAAGILLFLQGIAQVCRCIVCMREGAWPRQIEDVKELEDRLLEGDTADIIRHGTEATDVQKPSESVKREFDR